MVLWRTRRFLYTTKTYDFMEKFFSFIILIPTPVFPHFYYMLGGNLGSLLYGDVSVMLMYLILSANDSLVQPHYETLGLQEISIQNCQSIF